MLVSLLEEKKKAKNIHHYYSAHQSKCLLLRDSVGDVIKINQQRGDHRYLQNPPGYTSAKLLSFS